MSRENVTCPRRRGARLSEEVRILFEPHYESEQALSLVSEEWSWLHEACGPVWPVLSPRDCNDTRRLAQLLSHAFCLYPPNSCDADRQVSTMEVVGHHPKDVEQLNPVALGLAVTASLERDLRCLLQNSIPSQEVKKFHLLKEVIQHPAITNQLGACCQAYLVALLGPPETLNIRNLLWHGFLDQGDLPQSFLDALCLLAAHVHQKVYFVFQYTHENRTDLACPEELLRAVPTGDSIFENTPLDDNGKAAVEYFKMHLFFSSSVLMLISIEHRFREWFARENNCPERAYTACSSQLFTTFDHILAPRLDSGQQNCLWPQLGAGLLEFLYDLLIFPKGPRLRDRLSHGQLNSIDDPRVCTTLIAIGRLVHTRANYNRMQADISVASLEHRTQPQPFFLSTYTSIFHPAYKFIFLLKQSWQHLLMISKALVTFTKHFDYDILHILNNVQDQLNEPQSLQKLAEKWRYEHNHIPTFQQEVFWWNKVQGDCLVCTLVSLHFGQEMPYIYVENMTIFPCNGLKIVSYGDFQLENRSEQRQYNCEFFLGKDEDAHGDDKNDSLRPIILQCQMPQFLYGCTTFNFVGKLSMTRCHSWESSDSLQVRGDHIKSHLNDSDKEMKTENLLAVERANSNEFMTKNLGKWIHMSQSCSSSSYISDKTHGNATCDVYGYEENNKYCHDEMCAVLTQERAHSNNQHFEPLILQVCFLANRLCILDAVPIQRRVSNLLYRCAQCLHSLVFMVGGLWISRIAREKRGTLPKRNYIAQGKMHQTLPIFLRALRLVTLFLRVEICKCCGWYGCFDIKGWYCSKRLQQFRDFQTFTPQDHISLTELHVEQRVRRLCHVLQFLQNATAKARGMHWDDIQTLCDNVVQILHGCASDLNFHDVL